MLKRMVMLAGAAVVLLASPVGAQTEYDGASGETSVLSDGTVRVTGEGCPADVDVVYSVTKDGTAITSGSSRADANGDYSFSYMSQGGGAYSASVACGNVGLLLDTVVPEVLGTSVERGSTAQGPTGERSGALAFTGSERTVSVLQVGAVLVVLGGLGIYAARRRSDTTSV